MFLNYINAFRAIAIFFVIALHTIHIFNWQNSALTEKFIYTFFSNGSIFFIFVSGYLFQHLSGKFEAKKFYFMKIKNVLLPYLIISIPAIYGFISSENTVTHLPNFNENPVWQQIFHAYLYGLHAPHFWFIPMMLLFFLIAPLLIWSDKNNFFYWLLPLLIVVSCSVHRGLPLDNFIYYFSIYILGMFSSKFKQSINLAITQKFSRTLLLLTFVIIFSIEYFSTSSQVIYINFLQKIVLIFLTLSWLIQYENKLDSKYIMILANKSFGIYFLHGYILYFAWATSNQITKNFTNSAADLLPGNILIFIIACVAVLLSCIAVIFLIEKALGSKSYLLVGYCKMPTFNKVQENKAPI